jgi:hypothetical protein
VSNWITRISVSNDGRAEAECLISGRVVSVSSAGLAELRRKLYAMGFTKRAIATAVKDVESEAG